MEFDDFVDSLLRFRATDESVIKGIFDLQTLFHDHFAAVHTELSSIDELVQTKVCSRSDGQMSITSQEYIAPHDSVMIKLQKIESMLEPLTLAVKAMQPDGQLPSEKSMVSPKTRKTSSSEGAAAATGGALPGDSLPLRQPAPTNRVTQEQQFVNEALKAYSSAFNRVAQPACNGAPGVRYSESINPMASLASKSQEAAPLLDFGARGASAQEIGQARAIASNKSQSAQKIASKPEEHGAGDTISDFFFHRALFGEQVSSLQFRISWDGEQPMILAVIPGGEAEKQGLWAGDVLTEINGTMTLGRPREELLPILAVRPLLIIAQRRHERTPV